MAYDVDKISQSADAIAVGDTVAGRYRVIRILGAGGMGVVYEALDAVLGVSVALKVMRQSGNYRLHRGRFRREARTEQALSHPNIIHVLGSGELEDGRLYIVSELLLGETLGQAIARRGTLPVEDAVHIAIEVLKALEEAHAAGVIHRDLKPDNIYLLRTGGLKVLDFGMVKLLNRQDSIGPLTRTGTIGGTPQYISPEMAKGRTVDARSDLYALGIILFEMLTGNPPFDATAPVDVLLQQINTPVPPLDCPRNDCPLTLIEIIDGVLSKPRDDRPASAKEFRAQLASVAKHLPLSRLVSGNGSPARDAINLSSAGADRPTDSADSYYVEQNSCDTQSSEHIVADDLRDACTEEDLQKASTREDLSSLVVPANARTELVSEAADSRPTNTKIPLPATHESTDHSAMLKTLRAKVGREATQGTFEQSAATESDVESQAGETASRILRAKESGPVVPTSESSNVDNQATVIMSEPTRSDMQKHGSDQPTSHRAFVVLLLGIVLALLWLTLQ